MTSVASGGTAERIVARILLKVVRAGSGTLAMYSSTSFGATLAFAVERLLPDFAFHRGRLSRTAKIDCAIYPRLVFRSAVDYACAAFASLRVIETFTVNGRDLRAMQRRIAGELAAMVNSVIHADLQEGGTAGS